MLEICADRIASAVGAQDCHNIVTRPVRHRRTHCNADEIVYELLDAVVTDLPDDSGDEVALMINGLGGTPPESRPIVIDITQCEDAASRNAGRGGPLA